MASVQEVSVRWSRPVSLASVGEQEQVWRDCLYAIIGVSRRENTSGGRNRRLFYIGFSERHLWDRFTDQNHKLHKINAERSRHWNVRIRTGYVDPGPGRRLSQSLALEIESALIWEHMPMYNVKNTKTWYGRDMLIRNTTASGRGTIPVLKPSFRM